MYRITCVICFNINFKKEIKLQATFIKLITHHLRTLKRMIGKINAAKGLHIGIGNISEFDKEFISGRIEIFIFEFRTIYRIQAILASVVPYSRLLNFLNDAVLSNVLTNVDALSRVEHLPVESIR